jgi:hypothetical protein
MGREEDMTGSLRGHRAIAQDEVREDREHRSARRALKPPDGDATETDADLMRVACETPAPTAGCLVLELKAKGHDEGDDTFEERLPIAKQLEVGRFAPEIDSDGTVFARRLSRCAHVLSPCHQVLVS